ncbi:NAD(P)H-dependent oxidoreductase [Chloroflexota bacterium]
MVLISPVYSYNVTALMKAFIDRLYSFYNFSDERPGYWSSQLADQGRKAIIAVVGEQATPTSPSGSEAVAMGEWT